MICIIKIAIILSKCENVMKKVFVVLLFFVLVSLSAFADDSSVGIDDFDRNPNSMQKEFGKVTSQPYKVKLLDDSTSQTEFEMTLKIANKTNLSKLKVGQKFLLVLPDDLKLETGEVIPTGTKFSATVVMKKSCCFHTRKKIKFIINEIIFTDTRDFILVSNPKNIHPLKTISAERILGKNAKVDGIFRIGTVIKKIKPKSMIKMSPDTTTAVGICVLAYPSILKHTLNAGTPITFIFETSIKPEVMCQ